MLLFCFALNIWLIVFLLLHVVLELVLHKGLVSVFDNGEVLELLQPVGNVSGGHEEASEKHEQFEMGLERPVDAFP